MTKRTKINRASFTGTQLDPKTKYHIDYDVHDPDAGHKVWHGSERIGEAKSFTEALAIIKAHRKKPTEVKPTPDVSPPAVNTTDEE